MVRLSDEIPEAIAALTEAERETRKAAPTDLVNHARDAHVVVGERARDHALNYDAGYIARTRWAPFLDRLAADLSAEAPEPAPPEVEMVGAEEEAVAA
jgi:hypothetical protein